MTHRLTINCAKNYCNWTLIVKVILENVVTCFLGHGVVPLLSDVNERSCYFTHSNHFTLFILYHQADLFQS